MSHQVPPEVDWKKIQEAFNRATRSSGHSSEDSSPDNDSQEQHNTSPSSTPIPSPNPDTDVEMAQEEDLPEHAPDMFLSRASDIITDSVIGVDQLHPPTAQHIRQDPSIPAELLPFLTPLGLHNLPSASSGEGGIVIDTVADPRQRGPDNRLRPPQKCLSCQTTQTPEWRRGPYGPRTLCNACGLTYAKLVRDNNNRNKKGAGIKELDSTGPAALSLSAPHQSSNTVAGPSYSNRYASAQPSGSGVHHAGVRTSDSPIDVDLHERGSELSGEPLDLDADLQGTCDPDLEADEMNEDKSSEKGTPPPTDFATASFGPGHGHGGSHSQQKYHPHYHG